MSLKIAILFNIKPEKISLDPSHQNNDVINKESIINVTNENENHVTKKPSIHYHDLFVRQNCTVTDKCSVSEDFSDVSISHI